MPFQFYIRHSQNRKIFHFLPLIFLLLPPKSQAAQPFQISEALCLICNQVMAPFGSLLQTKLDTLTEQMSSTVNSYIPNPETMQGDFLKAMGGANGLAVKGLGVDYASNVGIFMLGASASATVDSGSYPINDFLSGKIKLGSNNALPSIGAGIQASFNIGFSLGLFKMLPSFGFFDPKKLTLYAQYLSLSLPSTLVSGLSGQASNWGLFAQYRLFNPIGLGLGTLQWGGILIQAGFISSSQKVLFEVPFSDSQKITDSWQVDQYTLGYDLTLDWSTKGTLGAQILSTHLPLEVSTSARLLYMFSWYGGLGLDLNWGTQTTIADVSGQIKGTYEPEQSSLDAIPADALALLKASTSTKPLFEKTEIFQAKAKLDLGHTEKPNLYDYRYFTGFQLNLALLRAYLGIQRSLRSQTLGLNLGVRLAW